MQVEKGRSERSGRSARQEGSPPEPPGEFDPFLQHTGHLLANKPMNVRVSSDHRPPMSPAKTPNALWHEGLARARTAPSTLETPRCRVPCREETNVMSTASWAPPKRSSPSATISNRRLSLGRRREVQISDHHVSGGSGPTLATDSRPCALHCKPPPAQHASSSTRRTMMAKRVEKTVTSTRVQRERERETESAKKKDPEQMSINSGEENGRCSRESHPSEWATLGAQEVPLMVCTSRCSRSTRDEASCCQPWRHTPGSCSTTSWNGGLAPSARSSQEGGSEPCTPGGRRQCGSTSCVQGLHNSKGHLWMTRPDHGQRVGPTGPERTWAGANCIP